MDVPNVDDEGLTLEEWRARAIAAEALVQKLRGLIQKLEDDKAVFLQELSESDSAGKAKKKNFNRRSIPKSRSNLGLNMNNNNEDKDHVPAILLEDGTAASPNTKRKSHTSVRKKSTMLPAADYSAQGRIPFLEWLKTQEELVEFVDVFDRTQTPRPGSTIPVMWSEKRSKGLEVPDQPHKFEIELDKAPLDYIIDLALTTQTNKISQIWDRDTFIKEFAFVSRAFITRKKLLLRLTDEYTKATSAIRKEAIIHFLKVWVETKNAADFQDEKMRKMWDSIVSIIQADKTMQVVGNFLMGYIENLSPDAIDRGNPPPLIEPTGYLSLMTLAPLEVARQLTLALETLMRAVPRHEYFQQKCHKAKLKPKAPNLMKVIKYIGFLGGWVIAEVLSQPERKQRIQLLERFIEIAKHCRSFRNYAVVFTFAGCLQGVLTRLKKDWKEVDKDRIQDLEILTQLVDNSNKFRNYNQELASIPANEPCIPFIQVTIGDIEKLDEVSGDAPESHPDWINWFKFHTITKCVTAVTIDRPYYQFKESPLLQKWILSCESWPSSNAHYFLSSLRESVDEWPKDIVRLPTKSLYDASPFTSADWKYIVKVTDAAIRRYAAGADVLGVGSNYYIFRVIRGEAEIKNGPRFKPGDFFGEMSLCLSGNNSSKITAVSELEVHLIEFSELGRKLVELPALALKFYHWIAYLLGKRLVNESMQDEEARKSDPILLTEAANRYGYGAQGVKGKTQNWHQIFEIPDELDLEVFSCQHGSGFSKSNATLGVTAQQVCLVRTNFGFTKLEKCPIGACTLGKKKKGAFQLNNWSLSGFSKDCNEIYTLISSFKETELAKKSAQVQQQTSTVDQTAQCAERWLKTQPLVEMSHDDWEILLKGATKTKKPKGAVVITKGEPYHIGEVYQLSSGAVDIQIKPGETIASIQAPDLFGEISFLTGNIPTASVVATCDLDMVILEPYYLNVLFQHYPDIGARFYFFLAQSLATRILKRNINT